MSTQQRMPAIPRVPRSPLTTRVRRATAVSVALAALTVTAWVLICPRDWSPATGAPTAVYSSAVRPWQWGVIGLVLLTLAGVSGAFGYRLLSLFSVATPAFLLFCHQSASARVTGPNPWVIASIGVMPVIYCAVGALAILGHLARQHVKHCRATR